MKKTIGVVLIVMLVAPAVAWCKIGGDDVRYRPAGADPTVFKHSTHTGKAGARCSECHQKLYSSMGGNKNTTMAEMEKGQSCGACHNGKRAFATTKENCKKCHK